MSTRPRRSCTNRSRQYWKADNGWRRGGVAPSPPLWTQISWWENVNFTKGSIDLSHFWYTHFWAPDPPPPPPTPPFSTAPAIPAAVQSLRRVMTLARVAPPPQTKETIVGQNAIYRRENLIGPFLVHNFLGARPPPPAQKTPPPATQKTPPPPPPRPSLSEYIPGSRPPAAPPPRAAGHRARAGGTSRPTVQRPFPFGASGSTGISPLRAPPWQTARRKWHPMGLQAQGGGGVPGIGGGVGGLVQIPDSTPSPQ